MPPGELSHKVIKGDVDFSLGSFYSVVSFSECLLLVPLISLENNLSVFHLGDLCPTWLSRHEAGEESRDYRLSASMFS